MKISISEVSSLSLYEQIMNQIKEAILSKEIKIGEPLPSIRSLAKDLQISVITTKRAYDELEAEGLIESIAGKGFYVSQHNDELLREKQTVMLEKRFQPVINDAKNAGLSLEDILELVSVLYDSKEE